MNDIAVDRLRLRGPHARRLVGVAARLLPAALEASLGDLDDISLGQIVVRLDVDVEGLDDGTIATLWAQAIRTRVLAAGGRPRPPAAPPERSTLAVDEAEPWRGRRESVLAAVVAWLHDDAALVHGPMPRQVLALTDPTVAQWVASQVGPWPWQELVARLDAALPGLRNGRRPHDPGIGGTGEAPTGPWPWAPAAATRHAAGDHPGRAPADERKRDQDSDELRCSPTGLKQGERDPRLLQRSSVAGLSPSVQPPVPDRLAELAPLVPGHGPPIETSALTGAAGLVLLYPWLADHCRRAVALHPGLDVVDVREAALASVVDDHPVSQDDPLVALLAGRERAPRRRVERVPLPQQDAVAESALDVLRCFTALLPGFERSTPAFIRREWVERIGVLESEHPGDAVTLLAATKPLDVVLGQLPYPIGLIKLPWSVPLATRFRP